MALALASPMASLPVHSGRISAAAIGGVARTRRAAPVGVSASPASLAAAISASLAFTSSSSFAGENASHIPFLLCIRVLAFGRSFVLAFGGICG